MHHQLLKILTFNDSRKVAIGLWLFISSHILLYFKLIGSTEWFGAMGLAAALVGGGTIADRLMKDKRDRTGYVDPANYPQKT